MARPRKSKTKRRQAEDRHFSTRVVRRSPVDMDKLTAVFLGLAQARAERDAQTQHERSDQGGSR
ncbi:MAG: hypothetical protein JWP19_2245 [Rhodoglobus sp.]|nr:hypothetical protein [Rhodoglobus sp.]